MKVKKLVVVLSSVLFLIFANTAFANDSIDSNVTVPTGQPVPIIENNGAASGNIRLNYTWVTSSCTTGTFAQFTLNLSDVLGTGQTGVYPSNLLLADSGAGTPVQLSASQTSLSVNGVGWSANPLITVTVARCDTFANGAQLDGQMNLSVAPASGTGNSHINAITTIQVHITVMVPDTAACMFLYSFEANQDTGDLISSVGVGTNPSGKITNTSPGQISVDGLVANTCSGSMTFDLKIGLDPDWGTNPGGPGNATFLYTTTGEYDPSNYNLTAFGTGTAEGTQLCLSNVTLNSGDSLLATVHAAITAANESDLPNPTSGNFTFSATIYSPGSACGIAYDPASIVGPTDPATSLLPYTTN